MSRRPRAAVLAMVVATMAACTTGPTPDAAEDVRVVEVFTNYRGADADGFRAVLDAFTAETGIETRFVGTAAFAGRLRERIQDGDVPDVALVPQPAALAELARTGLAVPIELPDLEATMLPGAAEVGDVDGARYGVWFRSSIKSLVWFAPEALAEAGLAPPESLASLEELSARVQAAGTTPWCLGMESFGATGWVGTDWIEDLVLRLHGPDVYDAWVDGDIPFTDRRIREAFRAFSDLTLDTGRVTGGRRAILATPALEAIGPLFEDPPGCLLSRQASFQLGALPEGTTVGADGDVDVFVLPGDASAPAPLVAAGEIATALADRPEARALVEYLSTPDAGVPWAALGGFTSPHATFDPGAYMEPFDRRIAGLAADADVVRFDASDRMPTVIGTDAFWTGIVDFVAGAPVDQVLEQIEAARPNDAGAP